MVSHHGESLSAQPEDSAVPLQPTHKFHECFYCHISQPAALTSAECGRQKQVRLTGASSVLLEAGKAVEATRTLMPSSYRNGQYSGEPWFAPFSISSNAVLPLGTGQSYAMHISSLTPFHFSLPQSTLSDSIYTYIRHHTTLNLIKSMH